MLKNVGQFTSTFVICESYCFTSISFFFTFDLFIFYFIFYLIQLCQQSFLTKNHISYELLKKLIFLTTAPTGIILSSFEN